MNTINCLISIIFIKLNTSLSKILTQGIPYYTFYIISDWLNFQQNENGKFVIIIFGFVLSWTKPLNVMSHDVPK